MKKSNEILIMLRRFNELPVREVKEEVDSVRMTFEDWEQFTNHRIAGYDARDFGKRQLAMLENKTNITYSEYLSVRASCKSYMRLSDNSNRARLARGRREALKKQVESGEITEEQIQMPSEEELQMLEEIERQWNDVRLKYDPAQEIESISHDAMNILEYVSTGDRLEYSIRAMKEDMENLQKATRYMGELYDRTPESSDLDFSLSVAMGQGLRGLETLQASENLSVEEFMQMLGLDSEEVLKHFKGRMELAEKSPSARPSIMANEGKAFRLNDDGQLEITDARRANGEIADVYFAESLAKDAISTLSKGLRYGYLAKRLPERKSLSSDEIARLMSVVDQPDEIINWMVKYPNRVSEMQSALNSQGVELDMDSLISDMQYEVDNPYFDPDYGIDDERIEALQQILDQLVDRDLEEEYDPEYDQYFQELYEMEEADKHKGDGYINEFGEIIRPGASEPQPAQTPSVDDELLQWLNGGSQQSTEELRKQVSSNEATIAGNDETIKAELLNTILRQQKRIAEQEAEISQLRGQKEI